MVFLLFENWPKVAVFQIFRRFRHKKNFVAAFLNLYDEARINETSAQFLQKFLDEVFQ